MARKNPVYYHDPLFNKACSARVHWFNLLQSMYASVFRWENLPKSVDQYFMESQLADGGLVTAYVEKDVGVVCLPSQTGGQLNIYGYPTKFNVWGMNGYTNLVNIEDCAFCYDNILHAPPAQDLKLYADKLAELDTVIDVNAKNQKTPYIYSVPKELELSARNLNREINAGKQAIFINGDNMSEIKLDVIQTPAPYVADKIQQLKRDLLTEILNYIGVFSGMTLKAERVTEGENASNVGYIRAARNSRLNQRQRFAEQFTEKFYDYIDDAVSVKYSEEALETIAAGLLKIGDDELEQIYSYTSGLYNKHATESNAD